MRCSTALVCRGGMPPAFCYADKEKSIFSFLSQGSEMFYSNFFFFFLQKVGSNSNRETRNRRDPILLPPRLFSGNLSNTTSPRNESFFQYHPASCLSNSMKVRLYLAISVKKKKKLPSLSELTWVFIRMLKVGTVTSTIVPDFRRNPLTWCLIKISCIIYSSPLIKVVQRPFLSAAYEKQVFSMPERKALLIYLIDSAGNNFVTPPHLIPIHYYKLPFFSLSKPISTTNATIYHNHPSYTPSDHQKANQTGALYFYLLKISPP